MPEEDIRRLWEVLRICIPVFALIGVGRVLAWIGFMRGEHRAFLNKLVYAICLPTLIFSGVARQHPDQFGNMALLIPSLAGILVGAGVFWGLSRLLGYQGRFAAAFIFGTFWANVTYMGFPLSENAYGAEGLGVAAIYNAFCMPFFVILAFLVIGVHGAGIPGEPLLSKVRGAVWNPVVGSALLGGLFAVGLGMFRDESGVLDLPGSVVGLVEMASRVLDLIGRPGLPLALLSIGGALRLHAVRGRIVPLILVVTGKLVLVPGVSYLVLRLWFPDADPVVAGVVVLLGGMPNAVASYVIACKIGVEEAFVSTMLVVSTLVSMVTIPVWLYVMI